MEAKPIKICWFMDDTLMGIFGSLVRTFPLKNTQSGKVYAFCTMTLAGIMLTAGFSMFPFLMPSTTLINISLTM